MYICFGFVVNTLVGYIIIAIDMYQLSVYFGNSLYKLDYFFTSTYFFFQCASFRFYGSKNTSLTREIRVTNTIFTFTFTFCI